MKLSAYVLAAVVPLCGSLLGGCTGKSDSKATAALAMVDTDLSPRGAEWAGLSVQAPKGAKVWDDLGDCRVVTDGGRGALDFDLILTQKPDKNTIAARKAYLEKLAGDLKGKVTFDAETADSLDYTMETPDPGDAKQMHAHKSWLISLKVGDKTIGCEPAMSADQKAYDMLKTACKTIKPKA